MKFLKLDNNNTYKTVKYRVVRYYEIYKGCIGNSIVGEFKTIDDAINEAVLEVKTNKEMNNEANKDK